jgi:hypothetical protein
VIIDKVNRNMFIWRSLLTLSAVAACTSSSKSATIITETLPPFDGPLHTGATGPLPPLDVGTFNSIPAGHSIVSGLISGSFGNSNSPTSSAVDVYLGDGGDPTNDILVAQCVFGNDCSANIEIRHPWSHSFTPADIAALSAFKGPLKLTAIQTAPFFVRLGVTTLQAQTIPEPNLFGLLNIGLIALPFRRARLRRFVKRCYANCHD